MPDSTRDANHSVDQPRCLSHAVYPQLSSKKDAELPHPHLRQLGESIAQASWTLYAGRASALDRDRAHAALKAAAYELTQYGVEPLHPGSQEIDVDNLRAMGLQLRRALSKEPPELGSSEWIALDDADPRKFAAAVVAGFQWWAAELGIALPASAGRLDELVLNETHRELKAAANATCAGGNWASAANRSRLSDGARRRRAEARQPRLGDHLGGRVPVWGPTVKQRRAG